MYRGCAGEDSAWMPKNVGFEDKKMGVATISYRIDRVIKIFATGIPGIIHFSIRRQVCNLYSRIYSSQDRLQCNARK